MKKDAFWVGDGVVTGIYQQGKTSYKDSLKKVCRGLTTILFVFNAQLKKNEAPFECHRSLTTRDSTCNLMPSWRNISY